MGNLSVIGALAALFIGGLMLYNIQGSTNAAEGRLGEHQHQQLARDAAMTGLQLTVRKLADKFPPNSWTSATEFDQQETTYGNGTFEIDATPCVSSATDPCAGVAFGDVIDVDVVGYSGGTRIDATGAEVPIRHLILARFERHYSDGTFPPQFIYALIADNILKFQGNAGAFTLDHSDPVMVHSNGTITNNGGSFLVEGYGTYTDENGLTGQGETRFKPWVDTNGEASNVYQADYVPIIPLDLDGLREQAQTCGAVIKPELIDPENPSTTFSLDGDSVSTLDFTTTTTWDKWASGSGDGAIVYNSLDDPDQDGVQPCGGPDNPFVMLIEGDANFTNSIHVTGFGNIVTTGDFRIAAEGTGGGLHGDLVDTKPDAPGGLQTQLLAASFKDMYLGKAGGNTCFGLGPPTYTASDGHTVNNNHCDSGTNDWTAGVSLQVEGTFVMRGNPYIVGGLVAREGDIDDGGSPHVFYSAPSESILDPGFNFKISVGPVLIAYSEWQCNLLDAAGNVINDCNLTP